MSAAGVASVSDAGIGNAAEDGGYYTGEAGDLHLGATCGMVCVAIHHERRRIMRTFLTAMLSSLFVIGISSLTPAAAAEPAKPATPDWSMNATIIEACSCPMFCSCYFNTKPAQHAGAHGEPEHFCRFNNVFRVNSGHWGDVKLDGAKFWVGGDLGDDFSKGKMDWAVLIFDPAVTKQQREAITTIVGHLYPVQWNSFAVGKDGVIEWQASKDRAVARLDEGAGGQVILKRAVGMTDEPIVIKNLKYWGAPRNDGFVMMPNEVQGLRAVPAGKKPFQFENSNGFMITFDITSKDVAPVKQAAAY
jgi:hypothetical protein